MSSRPRNALGKAASLFFGVLLPLLSFAVNEILDPFGFGLSFRAGGRAARGLWMWLSYGYSPSVQRFLYPFILWAMLSLTAELFLRGERFRPWVRAGLKVGVATSGLFALWYAAVIPLALAGVFAYGLGLLGLAPFPAFLAYLFAYRANRSAARSGEQRYP